MGPFVLGGLFKDGKHIELICKRLNTLADERDGRLMVILPPGGFKSKLCSVLWPAWLFGKRPNRQVMQISHSADLAEKFGREVRNLIDMPEYRAVFPDTRIREDSRAAARWNTSRGGEYYAAGAGAQIAGFRGDPIIMDDVIGEQTARSDIEREKILDWYPDGLRSRRMPGSAILCVGTRWHSRDIQGYLLDLAKENKDADQWEVFHFPAILDAEGARLIGGTEGESFWPEMWPTADFNKTKENMDPYKWNAVYMGTPNVRGGNIFKSDQIMDWQEEKPPEEIEYILVSCDTAFSTRDSADFSAITVWGVFYVDNVPQLILLGGFQERLEFTPLMERIRNIYQKHEADAILVEKKASGQSIIQELRRQGLPVIEWSPDKDKTSRAHAVTPFFESGRIWMPKRKKFSKQVIEELEQFPRGAHDDLVDSTTMAILWMRNSYQVDTDTDPIWETPKRKKPSTYWSARP